MKEVLMNSEALNTVSPLKKRLITAAVLIPLFMGIILFSSPLVFRVMMGVIIALGLWEWTQLAGFKSLLGRFAALLAMPILFLSSFALLENLSQYSEDTLTFFDKTMMVISWGIILFWVMASILVTIYPKGKAVYQNKIGNLFIGILLLAPPYFASIALHIKSPRLLIYLIALVCIADSAAYFAGKKWGKHHFCPKVSPGKTTEGVIAALLAGLLLASLSFFLLKIKIPFFNWLLLNLMTVLFSIVGDLFESLFKREQNLKDSGSLLPGHGGVLDRLDSLTAAIPIFTVLTAFL